MPRLLFEKTGKAVWISHLDLMRVFQRSFKRAGLPLTHTHGYNPRPSVSIALPLSVGIESHCELLDFDLDGMTVSLEELKQRLNQTLVKGVRVLDVYEDGRKLKHLAYLSCRITFEYDRGISQEGRDAIQELFHRKELTVPKKSKNGIVDQDMIPMIRSLEISKQDDYTLELNCVICCQNPTLNPGQFAAAVELYLPQWKPDFSRCRRIELYDTEGVVFR